MGTPSQLGHLDRVAATLPSQAPAGAPKEAPELGQREGQDVPLVRHSSSIVKAGIPSSRRYLPTLPTYPVSGLSAIPQIPNQLHLTQMSAHEVPDATLKA